MTILKAGFSVATTVLVPDTEITKTHSKHQVGVQRFLFIYLFAAQGEA
jgi:hypothetical protein